MNRRTPTPDFDTMVALYRHDAAAFEAFRIALLRQAIDDAPETRRPALEALLTRIESVRTAARTPEEAAAGAFRMMMNSVLALRDSWSLAGDALVELQTKLVIERARGANLGCDSP